MEILVFSNNRTFDAKCYIQWRVLSQITSLLLLLFIKLRTFLNVTGILFKVPQWIELLKQKGRRKTGPTSPALNTTSPILAAILDFLVNAQVYFCACAVSLLWIGCWNLCAANQRLVIVVQPRTQALFLARQARKGAWSVLRPPHNPLRKDAQDAWVRGWQ